MSPDFRRQWHDLISQCLTEPVPHILYQHIADMNMIKKCLEVRVTTLNAQDYDIEPLTRIVENAPYVIQSYEMQMCNSTGALLQPIFRKRKKSCYLKNHRSADYYSRI